MITLNIFRTILPKRLSFNRATGNFNIQVCYQTSLIPNRHYAGEKRYIITLHLMQKAPSVFQMRLMVECLVAAIVT